MSIRHLKCIVKHKLPYLVCIIVLAAVTVGLFILYSSSTQIKTPRASAASAPTAILYISSFYVTQGGIAHLSWQTTNATTAVILENGNNTTLYNIPAGDVGNGEYNTPNLTIVQTYNFDVKACNSAGSCVVSNVIDLTVSPPWNGVDCSSWHVKDVSTPDPSTATPVINGLALSVVVDKTNGSTNRTVTFRRDDSSNESICNDTGVEPGDTITIPSQTVNGRFDPNSDTVRTVSIDRPIIIGITSNYIDDTEIDVKETTGEIWIDGTVLAQDGKEAKTVIGVGKSSNWLEAKSGLVDDQRFGYYVYRKSNGGFLFMAKPNLTYTLYATTPYGQQTIGTFTTGNNNSSVGNFTVTEVITSAITIDFWPPPNESNKIKNTIKVTVMNATTNTTSSLVGVVDGPSLIISIPNSSSTVATDNYEIIFNGNDPYNRRLPYKDFDIKNILIGNTASSIVKKSTYPNGINAYDVTIYLTNYDSCPAQDNPTPTIKFCYFDGTEQLTGDPLKNTKIIDTIVAEVLSLRSYTQLPFIDSTINVVNNAECSYANAYVVGGLNISDLPVVNLCSRYLTNPSAQDDPTTADSLEKIRSTMAHESGHVYEDMVTNVPAQLLANLNLSWPSTLPTQDTIESLVNDFNVRYEALKKTNNNAIGLLDGSYNSRTGAVRGCYGVSNSEDGCPVPNAAEDFAEVFAMSESDAKYYTNYVNLIESLKVQDIGFTQTFANADLAKLGIFQQIVPKAYND